MTEEYHEVPERKTKMGSGECMCLTTTKKNWVHQNVGVGMWKCSGENCKKCVLKTVNDLYRKVDRKARKQWIRQEMINKTAEQRKRKNVNNEGGRKEGRKEGRKHYRRLRNELKRTTRKVRKVYLESICDKIMEFQRV
jgi:hypothetical protein